MFLAEATRFGVLEAQIDRVRGHLALTSFHSHPPMKQDDRTMETFRARTGDNIYPSTLEIRLGDHELALDVPQGVWNPTPHGVHLGNILAKTDFTGERVLELGAGCGIHTLVLGKQGAAELTITEIEKEILDNAVHNMDKHGVRVPTQAVVADWTQVEPSGFDTLVTNPPFTKSGKRYRRYFIDRLILDAHNLVRSGGRLIFVQSSMANVPRSIGLMEDCGMAVEVLGETDGPFRDYYFEDPTYLKEIATVPGGYAVRDGVHYERLVVFQARLP